MEQEPHHLSRRDFLRVATAGTAAVATGRLAELLTTPEEEVPVLSLAELSQNPNLHVGETVLVNAYELGTSFNVSQPFYRRTLLEIPGTFLGVRAEIRKGSRDDRLVRALPDPSSPFITARYDFDGYHPSLSTSTLPSQRNPLPTKAAYEHVQLKGHIIDAQPQETRKEKRYVFQVENRTPLEEKKK